MLSRRLIRIKVLQILYAYSRKPDSTIRQAEKELVVSLEKTYHLFFMLILLVLDLADYAASRIQLGKEKKVPTYEDLHPNIRFINNRLIRDLKKHKGIQRYFRDYGISWQETGSVSKHLYNALTATQRYMEYMNSDRDSYTSDVEVINYFLAEILPSSEELQNSLEEQSIYWNDELEFVLSVLIRFFDLFPKKKVQEVPVPPLYKNMEDEKFAFNLLHKSILKKEKYIPWIEKYTENWDIDRIALMDTLIMVQAITEILNFPDIPVRVSINEYIDIAKYYSTPKSSMFINGVLDRVVTNLREGELIHKEGRGLIGEI